MLIVLLTVISYFFLFSFSYFWIDPNLTLVSTNVGSELLSKFQYLGYSNRELFSGLYLLIIFLLFGIQLFFLFSKFAHKSSFKSLLTLSIIVGVISTLSYPFLSHDIFSYLFHSKILWVYHQNPHFLRPDHFSFDPWFRFIHWTQQVSPYGPVWDFYTLIPAILSFKKFLLNLYFLKLFNVGFFIFIGLLIFKITNDRKVFAFWFFNPFLMMEMLVNGHNDLVMIGLFVISLYFLEKRKFTPSWFLFLGSILSSKYLTIFLLPFLFVKKALRNVLFNCLIFLLLGFFIFNPFNFQIQSWYYSWLFLLVPFAHFGKKDWLMIFILNVVSLVSYYPFILTGVWETTLLSSVLKVIMILCLVSLFYLKLAFFKEVLSLISRRPLSLSKYEKS